MNGPSHTGPGADIMPAAEAPGFARDMNDGLHAQILKKPDRLAGFAHLPLGVPAGMRTVTLRTRSS